MADSNYTALGVILDESGSMSSHRDAAIDGYNEFLDHQKDLDQGRATLTRTVFNHEFPPDLEHADLQSAEPLAEETYSPGGRTALLDAIGYTVDEMGDRFDQMSEEDKPSNVLVAIITDGKENASEEYDRSQIQERIDEQEEQWGWDFIYIGAGVDDFADADAIGVGDAARSSPDRDSEGLHDAYDQMAAASAKVREEGSPGDFQEGGSLDPDHEDGDGEA